MPGDMARGSLRIYLAAVPGAGATYSMLAEGRRRAARGTHVVVAAVETRGRRAVEQQLDGLERVPPLSFGRLGLAAAGGVDVVEVLQRHPRVVLVDDLAVRADPDDDSTARWRAVERLLDAGMDVVATMTINDVESLRDVVVRITGRPPSAAIPDSFLARADQIEVVDITPEAVLRRLAHGNIAPPGTMSPDQLRIYRPATLAALRELTLRWVADRVEEGMLRDRGADDEPSWETRERVIVAVTAAAGNDAVVRRAARLARRSHAELVGVHVRRSGSAAAAAAPPELDERRLLVERLGGRFHEAVGDDVAATLVAFARAERATQLVLGASRRSRWQEALHGSVTARIVQDLRDADVHVITSPDAVSGVPSRRRQLPRLPTARRGLAWLVALAGLPAVTALGVAFREEGGRTAPVLAYLLVVAVVAAVGGFVPGIASALVASLLTNWFFTPPLHGWGLDRTEDVVALVVFFAVAAIIANFVSTVARRTGEADRARLEAEALARSTAALVAESSPLEALLEHVRTTFSLDAVAVVSGDDPVIVEASVGPSPPVRADGADRLELGEGATLVWRGGVLTAEDRRLLRSFAEQLAAARAGERLRAEAAQAALLAEANELRTAMLRSVSHDLRTPLASIKASVTSLLQRDVEFTEADQRDLLETIDEESDRLDRVVGNLLDMSRLQADALDVQRVAVGVDDLLGAALASLDASADAVVLDLGDEPPVVFTDPVLVERALANLLANAFAWSPPGEPVRVTAACVAEGVVLHIADRGPGVPHEARDDVFEPFQRRGDRSTQAGVGLGLAVARGFIQATGGTLVLDDTPGGGLSVLLTLPAARP